MAVAEHLNFTRAGEALGVTPGAASLQIRALEEYLSRQLFRRNGRVVELTTEGAALLPRMQQALGDLERALADTRGDRSGGPLRVTMLASFLQNWLLPRLPRLHARVPRIDLQVHTSEVTRRSRARRSACRDPARDGPVARRYAGEAARRVARARLHAGALR